ncbi:MAG TPA: hypothetical protein VFI73_07815 [Candidatus Nitrosopolaris sp.]|nr:hypothetical protein [Candidatus Nitrosopolaris sp.]
MIKYNPSRPFIFFIKDKIRALEKSDSRRCQTIGNGRGGVYISQEERHGLFAD